MRNAMCSEFVVTFLKKTLDLFRVSSDDPDLLLAQYAMNSKQIPIVYFLVILNMWALVSSFSNRAPIYLVFYIPVLLTLIGIFRLIKWWRMRLVTPDVETAFHTLRRTNVVAVVLGVCFMGWALLLFPYGDMHGQSHIAFYIGINLVGCTSCLMHIRSAALSLTLVSNSAFLIFFYMSDGMTFAAEMLMAILVSAALLVVLWFRYDDFQTLIASRKALFEQQKRLLQKQEETQKLSNENQRIANLDSLTGLPNRRFFFAEFERIFAAARGGKNSLIVCLLDLDGFKAINDMYGHTAGDWLLNEVGRRFQIVCTRGMFLCRLGGDEFAILLEHDFSDAQVREFGHDLCKSLDAPFDLPEITMRVSGSAGFARITEQCVSINQLYEKADYALYQAKKSPELAVVLFGREHQNEIQETLLLERALHAPEFREEVAIVFQPVVDICSNEVRGFEALARWDSASLGTVSPNVFIGAAERTGFIDILTPLLLEKALSEAANWPRHIRLSFNLSVKNVASREYVGSLVDQIVASGVDPKRVDFEVTETSVIRDFDQLSEAVSELKKLGVGISLDDFGTGYSSLKHLHKLPLDNIKIDRSFVANIRSNSASYRIVKSLLTLSRQMNVGCIVEGVETAEELAIIRRLGGKLVQGYYFSKPMPGEDIKAFLTSHSLAKAS